MKANDEDARDTTAGAALERRIRSEFREMRGVAITVEQAARLFGIPRQTCARVLSRLTEQGFLRLTRRGHYVLRDDGKP